MHGHGVGGLHGVQPDGGDEHGGVTSTEGGPDPTPDGHHHPGVTVEEVQVVVVHGDQQGPTEIPLAVLSVAGHRLGQPALRLRAPARHPERSVPVGAQQPVPIEGGQGRHHVAGGGSFPQGRAGIGHRGGQRLDPGGSGRGQIGLDEHHVLGAAAQHLDRRVRVLGSHGPGEVLDRAPVPPGPLQPDDRGGGVGGGRGCITRRGGVTRRSRQGAGDVGQHRSGLHRRELVRVTDQDQPGVGSDRLQQPRHQGQRHHGHLVDHHHVVRQPVVRVVAEPPAAAGQPAEQPVQGDGGEVGDPRHVLGIEPVAGVGQSLRQPSGGLAGRCRQRDPGWSPGLVAEHGEHLGDSGRLAGARSAGEHGDPLVGADLGRPPLQVLLVRAQTLPGEQAVERRGQPLAVHGGRGCGAAVDELASDRLLLSPVPLQVEVPGHQPQRPPVGGVRAVGEGAAGPAALEPGDGVGPGQVGYRQALLGRLEDVTGHGGQVDADRAEAQSPHGQGQGQGDGLVGLAGDPGHRGRRVDVGQIEHPGRVEGGQQAGRPGGQRHLARAADVGRRAGVDGGHRGPRSSRSDSSVISAAGGRQLNTPCGTPATRGVSGPAMPRRNR